MYRIDLEKCSKSAGILSLTVCENPEHVLHMGACLTPNMCIDFTHTLLSCFMHFPSHLQFNIHVFGHVTPLFIALVVDCHKIDRSVHKSIIVTFIQMNVVKSWKMKNDLKLVCFYHMYGFLV